MCGSRVSAVQRVSTKAWWQNTVLDRLKLDSDWTDFSCSVVEVVTTTKIVFVDFTARTDNCELLLPILCGMLLCNVILLIVIYVSSFKIIQWWEWSEVIEAEEDRFHIFKLQMLHILTPALKNFIHFFCPFCSYSVLFVVMS